MRKLTNTGVAPMCSLRLLCACDAVVTTHGHHQLQFQRNNTSLSSAKLYNSLITYVKIVFVLFFTFGYPVIVGPTVFRNALA